MTTKLLKEYVDSIREATRLKYAGELVGVDYGLSGREGPFLHIIKLKDGSNYREKVSVCYFNENTGWRFDLTSRSQHELRILIAAYLKIPTIEYAETIRHYSLWEFYDYIGYDRKKKKIIPK